MKLTYRQFLKSEIDLTPLGVMRCTDFQPYFCTPRGARVFGRSGVDGIHFCFVRGFGETVFAVSPMNGREGCVHPVAKSYQDFLRLLALHDAAAIEQTWQWDAAQLEDFEQKHPSSGEQQAVLKQLADTFRLRPMAEPWKYIHTVQTDFDYGKLRFSEEFYDEAESADAPDTHWNVTFAGGFLGRKGKAGKEIPIGKRYFRGADEWLIPAAYLCREGMAVDFAKRVPVGEILSFRERWGLSQEYDGSDWDAAQRMRALAENPFAESFGAALTVNGQTLVDSHGCSLCWDPVYPEENDREARLVREHYQLEARDGWLVWRLYFPWKSRKETDARSLYLHLWAHETELPGTEFSPEKAGDAMQFQLPGRRETYTITALSVKTEQLNISGKTLYTTELRYEISPELPKGKVTLRDFGEQLTLEHGGPCSCAVGVIGGADGPVAFSCGQNTVCSNVRKEEKNTAAWRLVFREKRKEDLQATLREEETT